MNCNSTNKPLSTERLLVVRQGCYKRLIYTISDYFQTKFLRIQTNFSGVV